MRIIIGLFLILFLTACATNNDRAEEYNNEGVLLLDSGEHEKANAKFHQALNLEDISEELKVAIMRNLSLCFTAQEVKDSALYYANRAYLESPKDSYFYLLNRAEYALLRNNINEARSFFEQAKEKKDDEMAIYNSLGMIYSGKYGSKWENYDKALLNNKKAYDLEPREPLAEALALSYMNVEQYSKSIPLWEKLIQANPANMEYTFQLGVALYFSGSEEKGEKMMQDAADRNELCRRMLIEMKAD